MKTSTTLFLLFFSSLLYSQGPELDSLKHAFNRSLPNRQMESLQMVLTIAGQTQIFQPDTAVFYVEKYLKQYPSEKNISIDNLPLYTTYVRAISGMGRTEAALEVHLQIIEFSKKHDLRQAQIMSLLGAASLNLELNRSEESNRWFQKAIDFSKNGDKSEGALVHAFMANLVNQRESENFEKYLHHAKQAFELFMEIGDTQKSMIMAFNIGSAASLSEKTEIAETFFEKAFQMADEANAIPIRAGAGLMLGQMLVKKGELKKAEKLASIALADAEVSGNQALIYKASAILASANFSFERYDKAIPFFEKAAAGLRELKDYDTLKEILVDLKDCYANVGQHQKAFEVYQDYDAIKDSILSIEKIAAEQELQERFKTAEQQAQLDLQAARIKRQQALNLLIGLTALFVGIISFLIWRMAKRQRVTNTALRRLDAAKSRFFTNISHELRTPLTLILAPLENAMQQVRSTSIKADLQTAHSNGKQLLTLVNEILDLSKLESGEMKLQQSAVHLENLLRRIFFSYHSLAQLRGFILSFSYHLPQDLAVKLDVAKFEKVVNNLLANAFKYSNPGGVITLRASKSIPQILNGQTGSNKMIYIEVQDTGKGIAATELDKIFDRFYQADGEEEPLQGGTGIGLAYAREIAHFFGGSLFVHSKPGQGSNFVFAFPLIKTELKQIPALIKTPETLDVKPDIALPLSDKKPHILIVEDNPEMSRFLVRSLSNHFHCSTASDGQNALAFLQEGNKPDLITSDVMMPNMDGFTFLKNVRAMDISRWTPVVLLTARVMEEDKLKGFALGVDDYLTKPFSTQELTARIWNLLRNKKVREDIVEETVELEPSLISHEDRLVKTAEDLVQKNLSNNDYKVRDLAKDLNYSSRQLERILKKLTGLSPVEFIREIRLQKAYRMLEEKRYATIAEVRYEVGIESASYFNKKFKERFGKSPKEVS